MDLTKGELLLIEALCLGEVVRGILAGQETAWNNETQSWKFGDTNLHQVQKLACKIDTFRQFEGR